MSKETEKLDAEIQRRFKTAGRSEFILNDKFKLTVSDAFGHGPTTISVMNLEDPNEGSKPLDYLKPEDLKLITDHFKHMGVDNNPFASWNDPNEGEPDSIEENPFID